MMGPTFKVGERVRFTACSGDPLVGKTGTVGGYGTVFPVTYLVQLDTPIDHPNFPEYHGWTCVSAVGQMLETA